jgi:PAS domain S-box-containing protein
MPVYLSLQDIICNLVLKVPGTMKRRRPISDLIFLLIILFLAVASFISYKRIIRLNASSNLVAHTNLVKLKLAQTRSLIRESEIKLQDTLRAKTSFFNLQLETDSVAAIHLINEIDSLTRDNPNQQTRIRSIDSAFQEWQDNLNVEFAVARKPGGNLSNNTLRGEAIVNKIQGLIHEMNREEDDLLLQRTQDKDRSAFLTPVYSLVFSFLAILVVTIAYFRLRYETQLRMKAEDGQAVIRNFFHQAPAMLAILKGPDHVFEFANQPFQELIGGRDPVGLPAGEAVPEAVSQGFIKILDDVYQTGIPFTGREMPLKMDRGKGVEKLFITFICQVLKDVTGKTEGLLVFCYEVSEQVLARNKLQEAESRSRLAIDAARMGTFDWDLQNQHFISSARLVEIFGYRYGEQVSHEDLINRFLPDDKPIRDEAVKNSFSEGSLKYEVRLLWPDKSIHWVNTYGKIFSDQDKNIKRMYGIVQDVTPQKIALEELRESESKFRLLANAMPQLIWTSDKNGNLNYFNQAVYDFSGLSFEELKNRGWLAIVHPDELKENIRRWFKSVETGNEFLYEHRFRNATGEYQWQLSRAIPQKDDQGNIQMWIGTSTNIQEQKHFMQELERNVFERTQSLNFANLSLKQTVTELEQTNAELASFNYIASHDLQEPLRKIIAFSKRIEEVDNETLSIASKDYFSRIIRAAYRMQNLIDAFLSYSQTNNSLANFEPTDFNQVLLEVKNEFSDLMEQKNIVLINTNLPVLMAIPFQINQLLTNLIGNAIKYTRDVPGPTIEISSEKLLGSELPLEDGDSNSDYWKINVRDNGIGFDQIYEKQIFELFQRLHSRQEYAGTGIGLAICKKIMRNHKGFITAEGHSGAGAIFSMYFPILLSNGVPLKSNEQTTNGRP